MCFTHRCEELEKISHMFDLILNVVVSTHKVIV